MKDLIKKDKHDHKLTNILKFVIFTIVMLAPFIAILSKIVYVSANKNAKDSYYGETINEEKLEIISEKTSLISGEKYKYISQSYTSANDISNLIYITNITNVVNTSTITLDIENIIAFTTYSYQNSNTLYLKKNDNTSQQILLNSSSVSFDFIYEANTISTQEKYESHFDHTIQKYIYNKYSYLDNVFYYAIDQSKDEELLSWTKDTPIYNAINSMNTGLGLSANHILTYLLTYWSIMIAIYIIFDIIIFALSKLTHWLN